jgi:hypothetical protein
MRSFHENWNYVNYGIRQMWICARDSRENDVSDVAFNARKRGENCVNILKCMQGERLCAEL